MRDKGNSGSGNDLTGTVARASWECPKIQRLWNNDAEYGISYGADNAYTDTYYNYS